MPIFVCSHYVEVHVFGGGTCTCEYICRPEVEDELADNVSECTEVHWFWLVYPNCSGNPLLLPLSSNIIDSHETYPGFYISAKESKLCPNTCIANALHIEQFLQPRELFSYFLFTRGMITPNFPFLNKT